MTQPVPVEPRPASSMLYVRDGAAGVEVFMVVRNRVVDFAANAVVFPGGKVTADDRAVADSLASGRQLTTEQRGFAVAALRESFEEAGLLRALTSDGTPLGETQARALDPFRADVDRGRLAFADLLATHNLTLDLDQTHKFAHIITPRAAPKRFDTHFYVAPAPTGHGAVIDMAEVVEGFWVNAATAAGGFDGRYVLMKPTRMVLHRLFQSSSVDAVLVDAAAYDPPAIEPHFERRNGQEGLVTPEVRGFPGSWEPMDMVWATSVGKK